jgi:peptidoglycan/LPS O-acetylase OafA/YrhL
VERKGYARFLSDRFLRLGLPLLAFGLILGPLTAGMVYWSEGAAPAAGGHGAANGNGFSSTLAWLRDHRQFVTGPLWFVQALLMFSLAYCAWRAWFGASLTNAERARRPIPGYGWWLLSALGVGAAALAIRQVVPVGVNVLGMQLGYFASYIFLFCLGIAAWRYDWLRQLKWQDARPWIIILPVAWLSWPAVGGLSWSAIFYAFWEPFIAWGLIAAWLLAFRRYMNRPSAIWTWLNRRSYAVYIVHPVVLVGISLLLGGWAASALVKFAVTGTLACVACWILADPLVRAPGVRRIV